MNAFGLQNGEEKMFFSNGRSNARGVSTLLKRNLPWKVSSQTRDLDGRFLSLTLEKDDEEFMITNVSAPTQDQTEAQIDLIDRLEEATRDSLAPNIIIAGDLNLCMDTNMDRNTVPSQPGNTRYRDRIIALSDSWLLADAWRQLHPQTKQFSFRRAGYASRLDYWLVSSHLLVSDALSSIIPTPLSDHTLITLRVGPKPSTRGQGLWKFNNSLLKEEEFTDQIKALIQKLKEETREMDPNSRWEWMKFKCKETSIKFSKNIQSLKKQHKADLEKRLATVSREADREVNTSEGDNLRNELVSIERELKEIYLEEANRTILRSRANWALHGEKPFKYFLNLEKVRSKNNVITALVSDDGQIITEPKCILEEERKFFSSLYSDKLEQAELESLENLGLLPEQVPILSQTSLRLRWTRVSHRKSYVRH